MSTLTYIIVVRMVLQDALKTIRVVFIDALMGKTWLIDLYDNNWAFPCDSIILQRRVEDREVKIIQDPWACPPSIEKDTKTYMYMVKRFALLGPFITDIKKLLIKKDRTELIESIPGSRQSTTFLLKQYLKRGMDQDALRPDFSDCGVSRKMEYPKPHKKGASERKDPKSEGAKVGAPRTISLGTGINVNAMVRKHLQIGADYWLSTKNVTLKTANDLVVETYYSNKGINPKTGIAGFIAEEDKKPTPRQLHYFIKTEYPEAYIRRKRNGEHFYELNERAILGMADSTVQGPGDEFQIDAAVANIPLVSQFDRRNEVGYPVVYFTDDVFSRLITGISAGYEGPSWEGARMVLINMVTPKVEYCKKYGINITEEQWPSHFAPKVVLGDKGELLSINNGENIIKNLGIDIDNTPSGRPDMKPFIERRFGIIKAKFRDFIPGYVKQEFDCVPRMKDSRLKAVANLYEFTQMLIRAVLIHNMTPIRDLQLPPEMVAEGLTASPLDLWRWGITNRSGRLHELSVEKTMINVMHRDTARVTGKGILYHGAYYWSETSIREEWFARARRDEWSVEIGIEPWDLGQFLLFDTRLPRGFEMCTQIQSNVDHAFKSLYEIQQHEQHKQRNLAATENAIQSERITHEHAIREVADAAAQKKRELQDKRSNSEKTRGIGKAREKEKKAERERNSTIGSVSSKKSPILPEKEESGSHDTFEDNLFDLLNKEKEDRGKGKDDERQDDN